MDTRKAAKNLIAMLDDEIVVFDVELEKFKKELQNNAFIALLGSHKIFLVAAKRYVSQQVISTLTSPSSIADITSCLHYARHQVQSMARDDSSSTSPIGNFTNRAHLMAWAWMVEKIQDVIDTVWDS